MQLLQQLAHRLVMRYRVRHRLNCLKLKLGLLI